MADYREISQEYAQGAIKAGILLNGAAAIAVLSQTADLIRDGLADDIRFAMLWWVFGTFLAAMTWLLGFFSTRLVDKSEREPDHEEDHLWWSNMFMHGGQLFIVISFICYLVGAGSLAWSFGETNLAKPSAQFPTNTPAPVHGEAVLTN